MAIDPREIQLTEEQKKRLAEASERTGREPGDLLDSWLSGLSAPSESNGYRNALEALQSVGAIGCFRGPADLGTNPKYMEGFGKDAEADNGH